MPDEPTDDTTDDERTEEQIRAAIDGKERALKAVEATRQELKDDLARLRSELRDTRTPDMGEVKSVIRELDGGEGAHVDEVFAALEARGYESETVGATLDRAVMRGEIYEARDGHFRVT